MNKNNENNEMDKTLDERSDEYVTAVDEDGKELLLEPVEYFFYNGDEYALLTEVPDSISENENKELINDNESALGCFVCKVTSVKDQNGEEMDEFTPVDDDALAEKLIEIVNTKQKSKEG